MKNNITVVSIITEILSSRLTLSLYSQDGLVLLSGSTILSREDCIFLVRDYFLSRNRAFTRKLDKGGASTIIFSWCRRVFSKSFF